MKNSIININNIQLVLLSLIPIALIKGTAASEAILVLIVILFLIDVYTNKDFKWLKTKEFYFLFIIWIYLLVNSFLAINFQLSISRSFFFFRYILLIFAIQRILNKDTSVKFLFVIWTASILITSLDIYYEFFFKKNILGFVSPDSTRIVSFMENKLRIGGFMLGFFLLCCGYLSNYFLKKNFFIMFCILIFFLISIILTGERANTIKAVIGVFLFLSLFKSKLKYYLLILILLLPVGIFFLSENIKNRYISAYATLNLNIKEHKNLLADSLHGAHYNAAWMIFKNYPIFGIGNKNFRIECSKDIYIDETFKAYKGRCNTHPHQIYLEILSELGIVGFILIFGFIFYFVFQGILSFIKKNNYILLGSTIYSLTYLIPLIPTGGFFSSFNALIFWLNISIMLNFIKKNR
jgi:O-antigen ligase